MAIEIPTFLVRHGSYSKDHGGLINDGAHEIKLASDQLVELGVGASALILSSTARRTRESARILNQKLNCKDDDTDEKGIIFDDALYEAGCHPVELPSLDDLLEEIISKGRATQADHTGLVVVTHAPLIALAIQNDPYVIPARVTIEGGVYPYKPDSWVDPRHRLRQF
jgi:phosphohistidine phosphatase SixA